MEHTDTRDTGWWENDARESQQLIFDQFERKGGYHELKSPNEFGITDSEKNDRLQDLKKKILHGLFGVVEEIPEESNGFTGYKHRDIADSIVEKIIPNEGKIVKLAPIFVLLKIEEVGFAMACVFRFDVEGTAKFIDGNATVYDNWNDYLHNNELLPCDLCYPTNGQYSGGQNVELSFKKKAGEHSQLLNAYHVKPLPYSFSGGKRIPLKKANLSTDAVIDKKINSGASLLEVYQLFGMLHFFLNEKCNRPVEEINNSQRACLHEKKKLLTEKQAGRMDQFLSEFEPRLILAAFQGIEINLFLEATMHDNVSFEESGLVALGNWIRISPKKFNEILKKENKDSIPFTEQEAIAKKYRLRTEKKRIEDQDRLHKIFHTKKLSDTVIGDQPNLDFTFLEQVTTNDHPPDQTKLLVTIAKDWLKLKNQEIINFKAHLHAVEVYRVELMREIRNNSNSNESIVVPCHVSKKEQKEWLKNKFLEEFTGKNRAKSLETMDRILSQCAVKCWQESVKCEIRFSNPIVAASHYLKHKSVNGQEKSIPEYFKTAQKMIDKENLLQISLVQNGDAFCEIYGDGVVNIICYNRKQISYPGILMKTKTVATIFFKEKKSTKVNNN